MMRKCIMVKTEGSKKRKLSEKRKLNENNIHEIYKFCGNRGKFINFVEIGEYAICIIGLGDGRPSWASRGDTGEQSPPGFWEHFTKIYLGAVHKVRHARGGRGSEKVIVCDGGRPRRWIKSIHSFIHYKHL